MHELDEELLEMIPFQTNIDLENVRLVDVITTLLNEWRWYHLMQLDISLKEDYVWYLMKFLPPHVSMSGSGARDIVK